MIKHIQFASLRCLFWALLLVAVSISGLRLALAELNLFKTEIEMQLSKRLGEKITIERISGVLNGIKPELALYNIKIHSRQSNDQTDLQLNEIRLGLNLLSAIKHPLLEAVQISLIGARLSVKRLESGHITIKGLPISDDSQQPTWLMQGNHYNLIDSEIHWHDEKRHAQPIRLKHVNISIANKEQQHQIYISTDLPKTLGKSLKLRINFTGDMFIPDSVNAKFFVQGKGIRLAEIFPRDLPFDFSITQGYGDVSLWSTWSAAQMTQMSGSLLMHDAVITDKQKPAFPIDHLELQFKLQKQQQQWHLALKNTRLNTQQVELDMPAIAVALAYNEKGNVSHIALNCPQLNLGDLGNILTRNKVLPTDIRKQLQDLAITGQASNLLFIANPTAKTFAVSGQFDKVHTRAVKDIPGIHGLSLYIKGSEKQGTLQLSSHKLTLSSPPQFRSPLHFNHILGELLWQQQSDSWSLSSPMLEIHTAHIKSKNSFQLTLSKHDQQPANLSLQSSFYEGNDAAKIRHYLPVDIINDDRLLSWLDHAFLAGSVTQGGVLFRGALKDYPFSASDGVFEVLFNARDVDFLFANDWQPLEKLDAEIRFFADSLEVNIHRGIANQASIKQASVKIESFMRKTNLSIQGSLQGDLSQANEFLLRSPINKQIAAMNEILDMQGLFTANLDLEIPFTAAPAKIDIAATLHNAQLKVIPADLPVTDINANIHITEKTIFSDNLTARTLGFPIQAKIDNAEGTTKVLLSGQTDAEHLARQFSVQLQPYIKGISHYQVRLNIPKDENKSTQFQLITDLTGMEIDFPPFSKAANLAHPFSLDLNIIPSGIKALSLSYENRLSPDNRLDINLKKISPHWQGLIHSPIASGSIFIPTDFNKEAKISLLLNKLDLSALKSISLQGETPSFSIQNFPSLTLESKAVLWQDYNLGKLKLSTEPTDEGLFIKQLNINSTDNDLALSGYWQQGQSSNKTIINGTLLSKNFGHLLHQLQLSENIADATADLQFSLNWPDTPDKLSTQTITGTVIASLADGRILGVDPGLGRILGALDVWKLFKRLRFDFSDITATGLSFSEINAETAINQGLVSTKKFTIDAMPAEINITGTTHLSTREVDLRATVLPKFPIAGTIIGSVANAVTKTFIGNKHTGGLILSLLYEVKGTWDQFSVNRQFNSILETE